MRWLQFNLKSLLILVFVVALPCAWLAWKLDLKRRERAAVAEIKKLGGLVQYCHEPNDDPPGPRWVRKLLGDDFFAQVDYVAFSKATIGDSDLMYLRGLNGVEEIAISGSSVANSVCDTFTDLPTLKRLKLTGPNVTDSNVVHLTTLTQLKELSITFTAVTDAAVVHLAKLQGLEELTVGPIGPGGMSEAGVARLEKSLPNCNVHELIQTRERWLEFLKSHPTLAEVPAVP